MKRISIVLNEIDSCYYELIKEELLSCNYIKPGENEKVIQEIMVSYLIQSHLLKDIRQLCLLENRLKRILKKFNSRSYLIRLKYLCINIQEYIDYLLLNHLNIK